MAKQTQTKPGLDALLGATLELTNEVYIPRLKTHFTIKALGNEDMRKIGDRASKPDGKGGKTSDDQLFNTLVIVKGCVDPDFNDKALKAHYGAADDADCVTKALLPGEMSKVLQAILNLSGFGNEEELIEDAKN
ncbi:phage tail assembly chaperone [Paenibacillus sp. HGF5]|uniref:phage tail assembly chaperone n=1 Tax=Paenibacillus sp. HGF5 TaxID=908341 RepID=UPI0002072A1C|nr:phage XkdN-like protein [Paenibacillus sp. HGF5]EGG36512.1 phage XkdN-like protein [Paenibacillus sp. HGF5]